MEDGLFYALVSALHEGAADDTQWLLALDQLSDAFGGAAIFLGSTHRDGTAFELSGHRVDPLWIELVNGQLAGHDANPIFSTVSSALRSDPMGTVMRPMILSKMIPPDEYHQSPIYLQAIAPAGHEHVMVMVLHADISSALSLTLARPAAAGDFGPDDQRIAGALGPHILAALRLRHQVALARSTAFMIEQFNQGVILLSGSGLVVGSNFRAQQALNEGDGLTVVNGELRAAYPADTQRLRHAVQETDRAARGASLLPRATLRLHRPSGKPDLVVRASPVAPSVASTFGVGELATVALFMHDPDHSEPVVADLIADAFGLSKSEAAVAARIWEGDSVGDAARELGVSPNTVKSHLKVIFEKVGVDRQASLVRKIATMIAAVGHE